MKTIISDFYSVSDFCASEIIRLVSQKPDAVLAFSAEPCLYGIFDALAKASHKGTVDFSRVRCFSVTELVGSPVMADIIGQRLLDRINIPAENRCLLSDESFSDYDGTISRFGGIDALLLGIGNRAQIGFNESGTPFSSLTHISKLSSFMKSEMDYIDCLPERGLTMGIRTITEAKNIYVPVFGSEKSDAVFKMLYGRNDGAAPAAFLQIPMNVTVLSDADAASKL